MALSKNFFNFLHKHNTSTDEINSLIVSNYLVTNEIIDVNNSLISGLFNVSQTLNEFIAIGAIETFEDLIEAFEFVISPSDKVLNGAVYTPKYIRNFIVEKCFQEKANRLSDLRIGDISCGCGGFLLTAVEYLKANLNKSYYDIFSENIFGIDIEKYSVERTRILLSLFAITNGEDPVEFKFNLYQGNSLNFDWRATNTIIALSHGFDVIIGNPPYVCSRNMDIATLEILKNLEVSSSGHPDLYIPFFQIGIENLNETGVLGYITVNTFLKSINGRALRNYFSRLKADLKIINFGGEQLFKDRNTYTCLCFISLNKPLISYIRTNSQNLNGLNFNDFKTYNYNELNHFDGWNLANDEDAMQFITKIENVGKPFGKLYETRNGIATLKNDIYKFKPFREDQEYYYLIKGGVEYSIEKSICRDIVNANKVKKQSDIQNLIEKIIFPYDINLKILPEKFLSEKYPHAFKYLLNMKEVLKTRDKGNGWSYEEWFAYGRRQSLDINKHKLFFAHISKRPQFVLCEDKDLLFYNGIAVIADSTKELLVLKSILESETFFKYIQLTTKDYSSGYISLSRNYIKNFGILQLDEEQIDKILFRRKDDKYIDKLYNNS